MLNDFYLLDVHYSPNLLWFLRCLFLISIISLIFCIYLFIKIKRNKRGIIEIFNSGIIKKSTRNNLLAELNSLFKSLDSIKLINENICDFLIISRNVKDIFMKEIYFYTLKIFLSFSLYFFVVAIFSVKLDEKIEKIIRLINIDVVKVTEVHYFLSWAFFFLSINFLIFIFSLIFLIKYKVWFDQILNTLSLNKLDVPIQKPK